MVSVLFVFWFFGTVSWLSRSISIVRSVSETVSVLFLVPLAFTDDYSTFTPPWTVIREFDRACGQQYGVCCFFCYCLHLLTNACRFRPSRTLFMNFIVRAVSDMVRVCFFCCRLHLLTNSCRFRPSRTSFTNFIVRAVSDTVRVCFVAAACIYWRILVYSASFANSIVHAFSQIVSFLFFAAACIY